MMFSADSREADFDRVSRALDAPLPWTPGRALPPLVLERAMTIREAVFAPDETVPVREAVGRVCAAPAVACPPAVPIAVSGEILPPEAVGAFLENGIDAVRVCK